MIFGNPALAWGALAFSIPLILHILNRSRFRQVEWGAMHLLESVVKVNHKRLRIEQLILLLVRCAIPALLAMCLARPILTGAQMLTGDAPVSLVILLDASYSMDTASSGVPRFQQAVDAACDIIESTGRGSEVAVIQTGGSPTPVFDEPVFDATAVVRRLKSLQGGYGASDMQQSLEVGLAALANMSPVRKELVVISDFQPADWNGATNAADLIQQQIAAMPLKPEVTLLPVGNPVTGNLSIESLQFSNRPIGVGQEIAVRAGIRNFDASSSSNVRLSLKIDGVEQSVTQVALSPNSLTQTLLPVSFDQTGSHVIDVQLAADDVLETDDRYSAAITVWDNINVLLVDGDPSSQPLKGETDFLAVALTPYSLGRLKLSDLVRTETVTASKMSAKSFNDYQVIVLANVPRLSDAEVAALKEYVSGGGALFVAAGNRIDPKWYNAKLVTENGLLPCEFGLPRGKPDEQVSDEQGHATRLVVQHFDHPALQFFNDPANGDLSSAEFTQWYELLPVDDRSAVQSPGNSEQDTTSKQSIRGANATIVARLDNGDPLLVQHSFGDGIVMQFASSCDTDWSNLPMRPVFVPLMQQLITTMAAELSPPRNIDTGAAAVVLLDDVQQAGEDPTEASARSSQTVTVVAPDGSRRNIKTLPLKRKQVAKFDGTQRPGVYTMTGPDGQPVHFVASTSRQESDLTTMEEVRLSGLAEELNAQLVKSSDDYLEQDRLRRNGREIWKYVLAALLLFMFLELVLQQRFSRVRI